MTTIYLDFCTDINDKREVAVVTAFLKDKFNLDLELDDCYYDNAEITGTKEDIIKYLIDPEGYDEDMRWIEEFHPELLEE